MKHFRPPILVKRPHRELVRDAAGLMADGRWRTCCDVAVSIRCKPNEAREALRELHGRGLLERDVVRHDRQNVRTYRKRRDA